MSEHVLKRTGPVKLRAIGYHSGDCAWFIKNQQDGPQLVTLELSRAGALALLRLVGEKYPCKLHNVFVELRELLAPSEEERAG